MLSHYDHIVVGAGALGAAAGYWLGRADAGRVLVCEQFHPGHPWGSSDDHSRIIRHAYHSPVYTALTPHAFQTWDEVAERAAEQLVVRTGGIDLARNGTLGSEVLGAYRSSLDAADIPYQMLDAREVRARWPQWVVDDDTVAMYQSDSGLVDIRRATAAHTRLARAHGVDIVGDCTVRSVRTTSNGVQVSTSQGTFSAGSLVVCAGSWLTNLLPSLGNPLSITLTQEQVQYFTPNDPDAYTPDRFPVWIWHDDHDFYGFPTYGEPAVKVARDMTGRFVTQDTRRFEPDAEETSFVRDFAAPRLPTAIGPTWLAKTCVYDLPRDRELVIGPVPDHPRVFLAVGAGHAGKFASLIGRILADLVVAGRSDYPIDAFRVDRPSLAPAVAPSYRLGVSTATPHR